MTFPKASVKLEKPPFFRGMRWKIMVNFGVPAFGLLFVLGSIGGVIEYVALQEDSAQSPGSETSSACF